MYAAIHAISAAITLLSLRCHIAYMPPLITHTPLFFSMPFYCRYYFMMLMRGACAARLCRDAYAPPLDAAPLIFRHAACRRAAKMLRHAP